MWRDKPLGHLCDPATHLYHPNLFVALIWDFSCKCISLEILLCSQGETLKLKLFRTLWVLEVFQIAHQVFYSANYTLSFKLLFHSEDGENCNTGLDESYLVLSWQWVKQKVDCIPSTCTVIWELIQHTKEWELMIEYGQSSSMRISVTWVISKGLGLNEINI